MIQAVVEPIIEMECKKNYVKQSEHAKQFTRFSDRLIIFSTAKSKGFSHSRK
jgi:hypothetical protein